MVIEWKGGHYMNRPYVEGYVEQWDMRLRNNLYPGARIQGIGQRTKFIEDSVAKIEAMFKERWEK